MHPGAIINADGRHVGLDFYDLLIEALIDRRRERKGDCNNSE
jgi:hypothetical protein